MRKLLRHRRAQLGFGILLLFLLAACFGPLLVVDPTGFLSRPLEPPSSDHWFGTTGQGQDVLAQTVVGTRRSLLLGLFVGVSVVSIGALVGTAAGYFGGWVDDVLSMVINIFLVIPGLPLMVVLAAYMPPGPVSIALILVLTGWAWTARTLRAQTLSLRQKDFVSAAIVGGESHLRIIVSEILPNMTPLLISALIGATTYAINAQVGLEFLGLGNLSQVTWGTNLYWAANDAALLTGSWWTFVPTGISVALVGFSLAMINAAIDELGNPRLRISRIFLRQLCGTRFSHHSSTPVIRNRP